MKTYLSQIQFFFWVGAILIGLSSCGVRATSTPEVSVGGANSVVISTFTSTPTDAPVSPENGTPAAALISTAEVIGRIPGLSPVNLTVKLEQLKFTCTAVKKVTAHYERTCLKGLPSTALFQVIISGRESFLVDFIKTSVLQNENSDNKTAIEILNVLAGMPYDGATPEDAKAWVENTIPTLSSKPDGAEEIVFGNVKYKLYGPPTKLTLEIGELP